MQTIILIDLFAAFVVVLGFHVAFRQSLVLSLWSKRKRPPYPGVDSSIILSRAQEAERESVLRMAGVMLMAFSFTAGVFSTLIAIFSRGAASA